MTGYQSAADPEVLSAIGEGQEGALAELYDRYCRQCYAFALRILGSEDDAQEAVQETFIRVWRNAAHYDAARASVPSWLLSITRNLCIDEFRRRRRRMAEVPNPESAVDPPAPERTDLEAERAIMGEQVRNALRSLPADQRSAIELVYFQGLSSQEVGQILNVPAPTVRSRLRLGLLKLGGILQSQGLISVDG